MDKSRRYDEKRLYCRMKIDAEVTFSIPDDNTEHKGHCLNLSYSGIQFDTGFALSKGSTVKVIIDTKSEQFQPANATVEVLRVEPSVNNQYRVAGRIIEFR
ncbi:MAG: PilZ domain-containing protein [Nitrospirota bacterium]|nr:PilZ domain-containing protein [Nitrospirota bacterium]